MIYLRTYLLPAICVAWACMTPVFAGPGINAEYSADEVLETADGVMKAKINISPGKDRREMRGGGNHMVLITRYDKKVIWNLMPEDNMYMVMPLGQTDSKENEKSDLAAYKIEQTPLESETINGIALSKSKIIMTGKDGSKMGGFMWTTKEGIMFKIDAISVDKVNKDRFKMELSNLKVAKQAADLFEIPKGYQKMDMGMAGGEAGLGNMVKGLLGK